jgi:hypothetical protein
MNEGEGEKELNVWMTAIRQHSRKVIAPWKMIL